MSHVDARSRHADGRFATELRTESSADISHEEWMGGREYGRTGRMWVTPGVGLHRFDGPALIRDDGVEEHWVNGRRHRDDGPAWISSDGTEHHWIRGQRYVDVEGELVPARDVEGTTVGDVLSKYARNGRLDNGLWGLATEFEHVNVEQDGEGNWRLEAEGSDRDGEDFVAGITIGPDFSFDDAIAELDDDYEETVEEGAP